jgi:peptide deformylase
MFRSPGSRLRGGRLPVLPFDLERWLLALDAPPPIVQVGATVLRRRALDVPRELLGSDALARLVALMVQVMRDAPGVGLAAPQIGVPLRLFVAEDPAERLEKIPADLRAARARMPLPLLVLVNPKVVAASRDEATFFEGCLSVRGYGALVPRAAAVVATGVDAEGRPVSLHPAGWPARIMQHEMDHLDGTLYVDRMLSRSLACEEELARWSARGAAEALRELVEGQDPAPDDGAAP